MTGAAGPEGRTVLPARPAAVRAVGQADAADPELDDTGLVEARSDRTGLDRTAPDRAGLDRTALDRAETVPTDADHTEPDPTESQDPFEPEPRDWAWVEEWREGGEPMPWGPGLAIACFTGFLVASAVYVLCSGLSSRPLVAIGVNVVVVAGLCPALWLSRGLPVLRWIAGGAAAGVLIAWLSVLVFLA